MVAGVVPQLVQTVISWPEVVLGHVVFVDMHPVVKDFRASPKGTVHHAERAVPWAAHNVAEGNVIVHEAMVAQYVQVPYETGQGSHDVQGWYGQVRHDLGQVRAPVLHGQGRCNLLAGLLPFVAQLCGHHVFNRLQHGVP